MEKMYAPKDIKVKGGKLDAKGESCEGCKGEKG